MDKKNESPGGFKPGEAKEKDESSKESLKSSEKDSGYAWPLFENKDKTEGANEGDQGTMDQKDKIRLEREKRKRVEQEKLEAQKKRKQEKLDAKKKLKKERERKAAEEAEKKAKEKAKREESARLEREKRKRVEQEKLEAQKKRKQEKLDAKKKLKEDRERKAAEEAEKKAKEKATREESARLEAEKRKRLEQEKLEAQEKRKQEKLDAKKKLKEDRERKAAEEAEKKAKEKATREESARLEAEKRKRLEQEKLEAQEKRKQEKLDVKKKLKEDRERKVAEDAEKKAKEKAKREERAKLEAEERERLEREKLEAKERRKQEKLDAQERAKEDRERLANEAAEKREAKKNAKKEAQVARQNRKQATQEAKKATILEKKQRKDQKIAEAARKKEQKETEKELRKKKIADSFLGKLLGLGESSRSKDGGEKKGNALRSIVERRPFTFDEIVVDVKEYLVSRGADNDEFGEISRKLAKDASGGDKEARAFVKNSIRSYILEKKYSATQLKDIIRSYYYLLKVYDDYRKNVTILTQLIFQEIYGLGIIDELLYTGIDEIGVNGHDFVWMQDSGKKTQIPLCFKDEDSLHNVIVSRAVSWRKKYDVTSAKPHYFGERFDGSRVTVTIPPLSKKPVLNIRKFVLKNLDEESMLEMGTVTPEFLRFLRLIYTGRPNFLIIGEQGVGKSTMLRFLCRYMNDNLGIGTIERSFELNLDDYYPEKNVIALQELPDHDKDYDAEHLFQIMLKQNRDIVIVGEISSPEEALVALKAMIRQAKGSAGTFHSSSPTNAVYDYKNLLMQSGFYTDEKSALFDVSRAIDLAIQLRIDRKTGKRYIHRVSEIIENRRDYSFEEQVLFQMDKSVGKVMPVGNKISDQLKEKLLDFETEKEDVEEINRILAGESGDSDEN